MCNNINLYFIIILNFYKLFILITIFHPGRVVFIYFLNFNLIK